MKKSPSPQLELFGAPTAPKKTAALAKGAQEAIQLAPGQKVIPLPMQEPGQVLVYDLQPTGDNQYRSVARVHERWIRLTGENVKRLGLGVSYKTIRRLMESGFVRGCQPAPRTLIMDLASFYAHMDACTKDPEFWSDPKRHKRYVEVCVLHP